MLAVKLGSVEMTKLLIESSPNSIHVIDKEGDNVLGIAVYKCQLEIFPLLLDFGIKTNLSNGAATTPLMLAATKAESRQVEAARALLDHGAHENSHGVNSAPLATAAQRGHVEMIKLLLMHNANINLQDSDGDSALHEAVYSRSADSATRPSRRCFFIASEECLGQEKDERWTFSTAYRCRGRKSGRDSIASSTWSKDGYCQQGEVDPLMMAAKRGHRQTVNFLVKNGASLVWKNNDDQNAAGVAKLNNRTDVLVLLKSEEPEASSSSCPPLVSPSLSGGHLYETHSQGHAEILLGVGGIEAVPVVEVVALAPATVSRDVPGSGTRVVPG
ncbi:hypothetical protein PI125_g7552 [Phytophthora idaei]|nr:hypothetical protein PI125_g7552 [Phytophthora idaei]